MALESLTYKGMTIYSDPDFDDHPDFWIEDGREIVDCISIEDAKDLIDQMIRDEQEYYGIVHDDTPCLPEPWWHHK